jgi:hypothetical protein
MTPCQRPANWDAYSSGAQVWGAQEDTAASVAEAEVTAKTEEVQATSSEAGKVSAEDAQGDLEAIATMVFEGGPSC